MYIGSLFFRAPSTGAPTLGSPLIDSPPSLNQQLRSLLELWSLSPYVKDTLSKLAYVIEQENNPQAFFSSNFVYANPDDDTGTLVLSHGATAAFTDWMSTEQGEPGVTEEVGVLLHERWCAIVGVLSTNCRHIQYMFILRTELTFPSKPLPFGRHVRPLHVAENDRVDCDTKCRLRSKFCGCTCPHIQICGNYQC